MDAAEFLPLTPLTFHILMALARGRAHGYAIGAEIERVSQGRLAPTTGSLYQAIKRLRDEGLLRPVPAPENDRPAGPPRLYFDLTPLGHEVARLESVRLDRLLDTARDHGYLTSRGRSAS